MCDYCEFRENYQTGKNMVFSNIPDDQVEMSKWGGHYYLDILVKPADISNPLEERTTKFINYCPMCGRRLEDE